MRNEGITPAMFALDITAANNVPFRALAIAASAEGPNQHRKPADHDHPIIEFYDRRYPNEFDGDHGQFTGGFYAVDSILGRDGYGSGTGGLNVHGGAPDWTIDSTSMQVVRQWLAWLNDRGHLR